MKRIFAVSLIALGLSGCASVQQGLEDIRLDQEQNVGVCPNVFALEEAARQVVFDGEPSFDALAWSAEIVDVRTTCRYVADRPIRARVEIDLEVGRGPAATSEQTELRYFVAVTRRNRALIAKEEFAVPVRIRNGRATIELTQTIEEIVIPRANEGTSGTNFEIAVGFALTRDQFLYNRSGRSLRFPEL